ncbi:MAG: N-acyl-D-aspartate/D-glutamate deacylase [Ilumatobacteraceae bacterium]|nr:N-acyl-D-aspartate/D-glutamate deacylase [Ilumatobacteraceae bacterium]
MDGTGTPGRRADVAFADGVIIGVGEDLAAEHPDATVVDATGQVVAPGFIDIHTHFDAQVFWDPALTTSCYHGVTTVVAGNCGFSIAPTRPGDRNLIAHTLEKVEDMDPASLNAGIPWEFETFPEYLDTVERRGAVLNYAVYIGHTPLRIYVMGDDASSRSAEPDEIETMAALVREAIEAGACGFATSFAITHLGADGQPIPSRWADRAEIDALCRAASESNGVVGINGATETLHFNEIYDLQLSLGTPFTYTAVLTTNTGAHLKAVQMHRDGMARGAQVWPQVSCRPLTFSMNMVEPFTLNTSPIFAELMPKTLDERRAAYADPVWRQRVRDGWAKGIGLLPRWETYEIMETTAHPELVGRRLLEVAEETGRDPFDVLLELAIDEPDLHGVRVKAVVANDDEAGVALLLNEPGCTLGLSDAGAHVSQLCDAPLPTDLLGKWVRDKGVLTIEDAVHKLTQVQADLFGFSDRGVVREGLAADLVVFDPTTVAPGPLRRVRDFPADAERLTADQPSGMNHLFVNGTPVIVDGKLQEDAITARPGKVLRSAR